MTVIVKWFKKRNLSLKLQKWEIGKQVEMSNSVSSNISGHSMILPFGGSIFSWSVNQEATVSVNRVTFNCSILTSRTYNKAEYGRQSSKIRKLGSPSIRQAHTEKVHALIHKDILQSRLMGVRVSHAVQVTTMLLKIWALSILDSKWAMPWKENGIWIFLGFNLGLCLTL